MYALLLGTYQKVELLSPRVYICSDLVDIAQQFSKVVILIYFPASSRWKFQIKYIFVITWYFQLVCFLILVILTGLLWYLFGGLISISMITNKFELFFWCVLVIWVSSFVKWVKTLTCFFKSVLSFFFLVISRN